MTTNPQPEPATRSATTVPTVAVTKELGDYLAEHMFDWANEHDDGPGGSEAWWLEHTAAFVMPALLDAAGFDALGGDDEEPWNNRTHGPAFRQPMERARQYEQDRTAPHHGPAGEPPTDDELLDAYLTADLDGDGSVSAEALRAVADLVAVRYRAELDRARDDVAHDRRKADRAERVARSFHAGRVKARAELAAERDRADKAVTLAAELLRYAVRLPADFTEHAADDFAARLDALRPDTGEGQP